MKDPHSPDAGRAGLSTAELNGPLTASVAESEPVRSAAPLWVLERPLDEAPDPASELAFAYGRLEPGGRLILTVRSLDGRPKGRRLGRRSGSDSPILNKQSLTALLFKEGFEQVAVQRTNGHFVITARRSPLPPPYLRRQVLSVVLPVYNERKTFSTTMEMLLAKKISGIDIEIILVESGSTDGTREDVLLLGDHPRVRIILQGEARGKGNAVRAGLDEATGDFVLIQDADLEYSLDDYEKLLEPLRRYEAGFVLGARLSADGSWGMRQFGVHNVVSRLMNIGHVVFLTLFNTVYGQRLHDPFTMYKVFRRDCLHGLTLECDRFDFDWELTAKLIRAGFVPLELPVSYQSRSFEEGKKVSMFYDPLTWIVACFKYRFSRLYG